MYEAAFNEWNILKWVVSDKRNSTSRSFKIEVLEDTLGRMLLAGVVVWAEHLRGELKNEGRCRVF